MANESPLNILTQGVGAWNSWRDLEGIYGRPRGKPIGEPNLSGANLSEANLFGADLLGVNLSEANLFGANLSRTDLHRANLLGANLSEANLSGAFLGGANLSGANLHRANLHRANLSGADLRHSILVETILEGAALTDCKIYGISAWSLRLEWAEQKNLIITPEDQPDITVDNLEVAQFVYLLLNNKTLRQVIDTVTTKAVLILGRFTEERKEILDMVRDALRQRGYLPMLFDFEKPASRDLTETISTLAHMARFIIADITEAKSIPQELQAIVPNLPSVPVQPLLLTSEREYGMFEHFKRYPWVLDTHYYDIPDKALTSLRNPSLDASRKDKIKGRIIDKMIQKIISPAEAKASELAR